MEDFKYEPFDIAMNNKINNNFNNININYDSNLNFNDIIKERTFTLSTAKYLFIF